MHHIFDHNKKEVTTIRFANDKRDKVAFGSKDGTISICTVYDSQKIGKIENYISQYSPHLPFPQIRYDVDGT